MPDLNSTTTKILFASAIFLLEVELLPSLRLLFGYMVWHLR